MELRFGSAKREDFEKFWSNITKEIISRVNVVSLGENEALVAGDILANMRRTGRARSIEDILIASSAITHDLILVTANTRHFSNIKDLKIENWLERI
jgi:tRNA(fMet)-specific endonuclease VapC